jgi:hypothetical protein
LRVTVAVVHTGSRLVKLACGTKMRAFVLAPIAGRASGNAAAAAALAMKVRLFTVVFSRLVLAPWFSAVWPRYATEWRPLTNAGGKIASSTPRQSEGHGGPQESEWFRSLRACSPGQFLGERDGHRLLWRFVALARPC